MKISEVIQYLSDVQGFEGDLELKDVTGFWTRTNPQTNERYVICSIGDGKEISMRDSTSVRLSNSSLD